MCTVTLLRRPGHKWPLLFAGNRDEMNDRPWQKPARHWADRPDVVAGLDETAGGSWLGINDFGLLSCILNRRGSLGPQADKRSRGEIVLEALDHAEARVAADALAELNPMAYRSFNLIIADFKDAYWLRHDELSGTGRIEIFPIPEGVFMITAGDGNDQSPRIQAHRADFGSKIPDPDKANWSGWQAILARQDPDHHTAMSFTTAEGFGTSSSSLIGLPAPENVSSGGDKVKTEWLFAAGQPGKVPFEKVDI
ncbi:NRDE family protein [Kiloniella laminariae]|uniref:NRDE family protein n=1 Tax=Kiloniella laminariae TaxID=454162 RepID=A0ABT4LHP3_9PROT|nr:NRDE family protein [Kiloniella laminariae]MCZ4280607.1 NRDE family protein [Kiloniella laminariae]